MSDMRYFGSYARFSTKNKSEGALLVGADHLVGMEYSVDFVVENGKTTAWAKNRYGKNIGFFDDQVTYRLDVMRGRGWSMFAVLSAVGFTDPSDEVDEGFYWGEVALFACPPRYEEETRAFMGRVAESLIKGKRPNVDLSSSSIDAMLAAKGDWLPEQMLPTPKKEKGTAILKSSQTLSEKLIEQGRAGNKGCYVVSYAFIAIVVVAILLIAKALLGF